MTKRAEAGWVFLAMFIVLMVFLLAGKDYQMDKAEVATQADKYRIYCNEFPMDAICAVKKNAN